MSNIKVGSNVRVVTYEYEGDEDLKLVGLIGEVEEINRQWPYPVGVRFMIDGKNLTEVFLFEELEIVNE